MNKIFYIIIFLAIPNIFNSQNLSKKCMMESGVYNVPEQYDIYLSGELHSVIGNTRISIDLFKQLYKYDSVRIFLIESGYCNGLIQNDYLENNNPLWLYSLIIREDIDFAKSLKNFYDSLPANNKFKLIGIDYEKGIREYFLPAVKILLPKNAEETGLTSSRLIVSEIKKRENYKGLTSIDPAPFIQALKLDIKNNETDMIKYWRNNYGKINKIIYQYEIYNAVSPHKQKGKNAQKYSPRDEYIYSNIIKLHYEYPNKKIFGQFGRLHIPLNKQDKWTIGRSTIENWESFSAKLNTGADSPFKGKVCSVFIYYPKNLFEKRKYVPIEKTELVRLEKIAKNNKATLFDLKCIDSTFYKDIVKTKFQYLMIDKY